MGKNGRSCSTGQTPQRAVVPVEEEEEEEEEVYLLRVFIIVHVCIQCKWPLKMEDTNRKYGTHDKVEAALKRDKKNMAR
jgi:hypothetical protein